METGDFLAVAIPLMAEPNTRHFVKRKERDWEQDLIDLGVDGLDKLWSMMMTLDKREEQKPPELDHDGSGDLVYAFEKEMPNGIWAYIKLKIKSSNGKCVSISCHPVEFGLNAMKNSKGN